MGLRTTENNKLRIATNEHFATLFEVWCECSTVPIEGARNPLSGFDNLTSGFVCPLVCVRNSERDKAVSVLLLQLSVCAQVANYFYFNHVLYNLKMKLADYIHQR